MTVTSPTSRISYLADGVTASFVVPFYFINAEDLVVAVRDTTGVASVKYLTSDYNVSGAGNEAGGSVDFLAAPAAGGSLSIYRDPALTQTTDYTPNGKFPAESHERALDKLTMIEARTRDIANRSMHLDDADSTIAMVIPTLEQRRGRMAGYSGIDGSPVVSQNAMATIDSVVSGAQAASSGLNRVLIATDYGALRSIAPFDGAVVYLEGYYGAGTAGGGTFYWDSLSVAAHDGGCNIQPFAGGAGRWIRILEDSTITVEMFGVRANVVADQSALIQLAWNYASQQNLHCRMFGGTYYVGLSQTITLEGGTTYCALKLLGSLTILGIKGISWLKMLDNQSTDAAPKFANMVACNVAVDNFVCDGLSFDLNGQNNKISPSRTSGIYNTFNWAAIMVSGSVAICGTDARLTNSRIANGSVINCPGVTCIATGQQERPCANQSDNVLITGMRFFNNGLDTYDHSSVYMWGNRITVSDCVFDHPTQSIGAGGPIVAAELHGSDNFFVDNVVNNYVQGVWLSGNQSYPCVGHTVSGNSFNVAWIGVGCFLITPLNLGLVDVLVSNNRIRIKSAALNSGVFSYPRTALHFNVQNGPAARIFAVSNKCFCEDTVNNFGAAVGAGTGAVNEAFLVGNQFSGFAVGMVIGGGSAGPTFYTTLMNNSISNMVPSTSYPNTRGIIVSGSHGRIVLQGNAIQGGSVYTGILLGLTGSGATFDSLHMEGNSFDGATTEIDDEITVTGRRTGVQALTMGGLPAAGTWKIGDIIYLSPFLAGVPVAAVVGSIFSYQYTLSGYRRITNGTGNVLNTDWKEMRIWDGIVS